MWRRTSKKRKRCRMSEEEEEPPMVPHLDTGLLEAMVGANSVSTKDNHIYFYSDVTQKSMEQLIKAIRELNCTLGAMALRYDIEPKIVLHINSDGGEVYPALAAVDTINNSKIPVVTIVEGCAASAATLLSVAGSERKILKHSHMLIHQIRSGFWGKMEDIEEEVENLENLSEMLLKFYSSNTKMTKNQLKNILKKDKIWNPDKCYKMGLVDTVME